VIESLEGAGACGRGDELAKSRLNRACVWRLTVVVLWEIRDRCECWE
jgi:hypothetical protein